MSRDDPFGLSGDREKTRIQMVNVGAQRSSAPIATRRDQPSHSLQPQAGSINRSRSHPNALVVAFAPLLEFAPELESAVAPENPEALRTRLLGALLSGRDSAISSGSSSSGARCSQAQCSLSPRTSLRLGDGLLCTRHSPTQLSLTTTTLNSVSTLRSPSQ